MLLNTDQGKNPKESKNPENGRKSSPWGKKPNHALPKSTTAMKFSMVQWGRRLTESIPKCKCRE